MAILTALMGATLIGASALAVDLSVQAQNFRNLQNVADAAALAGARDLFTSGPTLGASDQSNAVADALTAIQTNMGWPSGWASGATSCPGYTQSPGVCSTMTYQSDKVTVSTPPATPRSLADGGLDDVEVEISQASQNTFAGVLGMGRGTQAAHAVAVHSPGGLSLGFALFSNTTIQTGNSPEIVNGSVYAGRNIDPQSHGSSAFCANGGGYVVLGEAQNGDGLAATTDGQGNVLPTTAQVITPKSSSCMVANMTSGFVYQTGALVQTSPYSCPTAASLGVAGSFFYNSTVQACESAPITPPSVAPPTGAPVSVASGTTWNAAPSPGLYEVAHSSTCMVSSNCYDLTIKKAMTLTGVTIWLSAGASFSVDIGGGGGTVTWATPASAPYAIYGEQQSAVEVKGNNNILDIQQGAIFMPGGSFTSKANGAEVDIESGQAVVDTWDVESGNHPNPEITYSAANTPASVEVLRLVE